MDTPSSALRAPTHEPSESKSGFAVAYEPATAVDIGRAHTDVRHDLPDTASAFCCFSADWDPAYEFTAPRSNAWYMRLARALGISGRSHEGTMFDVVDELQRCEHISRLQSRQLYALVRAAMSLQYGAEKRTQKHRALVTLAGLCAVVVPVACGVNSAAPQTYYDYVAILFSIAHTLAFFAAMWGRHATKATAMRVDAEKIKAHIYRYESLAGEYADPPDYQVQYPTLMRRLSEYRRDVVCRDDARDDIDDDLDDAEALLVSSSASDEPTRGWWGGGTEARAKEAMERVANLRARRYEVDASIATPRAKGTTADPKRTGATAGTGKGTGTGVRGASKPDVAGQPGVGHSAVGQRGVTSQPSVGQPGVAGQPGVGQQGVAGQPGVGQQGVSRFASPGVVPGGMNARSGVASSAGANARGTTARNPAPPPSRVGNATGSPAGSSAARGSIGASGPKPNGSPAGAAGARGSIGASGPKPNGSPAGAAGARGSIGASGPKPNGSPVGSSAARGSIGASGPKPNGSPVGSSAARGSIGASGPKPNGSPAGAAGARGSIGASGPKPNGSPAGAAAATTAPSNARGGGNDATVPGTTPGSASSAAAVSHASGTRRPSPQTVRPTGQPSAAQPGRRTPANARGRPTSDAGPAPSSGRGSIAATIARGGSSGASPSNRPAATSSSPPPTTTTTNARVDATARARSTPGRASDTSPREPAAKSFANAAAANGSTGRDGNANAAAATTATTRVVPASPRPAEPTVDPPPVRPTPDEESSSAKRSGVAASFLGPRPGGTSMLAKAKAAAAASSSKTPVGSSGRDVSQASSARSNPGREPTFASASSPRNAEAAAFFERRARRLGGGETDSSARVSGGRSPGPGAVKKSLKKMFDD